MKIKIESDVFNIINRIKEIDKGYFVVYNTNSKKFEVHNQNNINTYCLTIPYKNLDARTIELIHKTSTKNYDKIIEELNDDNEKYRKREIEKVKEVSDYKIREVLKYSNNKNINTAFKSTWL